MCNISFILAKAVCWEPLWAGHSDWKRLYLSPVSGEKPASGVRSGAFHMQWWEHDAGFAQSLKQPSEGLSWDQGKDIQERRVSVQVLGQAWAGSQGPWQHEQDTVMMHMHYRTHTWAWCWGCRLTLSCPRTAQLSGRLTPPESHGSLMCSQAGAPSALRGKQWEFFPLKKNKHRKKALKWSPSNGYYCML